MQKLHLKGATAATAPDYFEEKFASVFAESESEENDLSGATAVTADADAAKDVCSTIGSAIGCNTTPGCSWGHNKCAPVGWNSAALATSTIATLATVAITLTAWLI